MTLNERNTIALESIAASLETIAQAAVGPEEILLAAVRKFGLERWVKESMRPPDSEKSPGHG